MTETFYDVMRRQGITRRSLLKFCSLTASALGLGPAVVPQMAEANRTGGFAEQGYDATRLGSQAIAALNDFYARDFEVLGYSRL